MKQKINLGTETVEFVRVRMEEILAEDPQKITTVEFGLFAAGRMWLPTRRLFSATTIGLLPKN